MSALRGAGQIYEESRVDSSQMDSSSIGMIVALLILVAMSAYFSATETAFTSLNRIRLKSKADDGDLRAAKTLAMAEDYDKLLSTILIGNNIVNNAATTISAVLFIKLMGQERGPALSAIILTVVILIFGEITPKSLAKESPESWAMSSLPLLKFFLVVLTPLNFLFTQWKKLISLLFHSSDDNAITEEELVGMVDQAQTEGGLDEHESDLIRNAIAFNDMEVSEILTPRVDLVAVEDDATMDQAAALFTESGYSRLPVYHDTIDNIVGVIHEKDFYQARSRKEDRLNLIKTPVLYTTGTAKISELLRILQRSKAHMAVVVDEYGGTEGIVTLEDIIEELVGEIWDEHDEEEVFLRKLGPDAYAVDAAMDFDDFAAYFHLKTDSEMVSVSGWVMEQFGRVPEAGDSFTLEGLRVEVTRVENHRIEEIHVE